MGRWWSSSSIRARASSLLYGHATSDWAIATDVLHGVFVYQWSNGAVPRFVDMRPITKPDAAAVSGDTCYVEFPELRGSGIDPERGMRELHRLEEPGSAALSERLLFVARREGPDLSIYDRFASDGSALLAAVDDPEYWRGSPRTPTAPTRSRSTGPSSMSATCIGASQSGSCSNPVSRCSAPSLTSPSASRAWPPEPVASTYRRASI